LRGKEIIQKATAEGRNLLSETESKELIKEAGINVTDTKLALSKKEAVAISDQMGYPIVLKIASHEITHKSDSGVSSWGSRLLVTLERPMTRFLPP